jgi:hypothetical protein
MTRRGGSCCVCIYLLLLFFFLRRVPSLMIFCFFFFSLSSNSAALQQTLASTELAQEQARADADSLARDLDSERAARTADARRHRSALAAYEEKLASAEASARAVMQRAAQHDEAADRVADLERALEDAGLELAAAREASAVRSGRSASRLAVLSHDWDAATREVSALRAAQATYGAAGRGDFPALVRSLRQQLAIAVKHNAQYKTLTSDLMGDLDETGERLARESAVRKVLERELERAREDVEEITGRRRRRLVANGSTTTMDSTAGSGAASRRVDHALTSNAAKVDAVILTLEREADGPAGHSNFNDDPFAEAPAALADADGELDDVARCIADLGSALDFMSARRGTVQETVATLRAELRAERTMRREAKAKLRRIEDAAEETARVNEALERENDVAVEQMLRIRGRRAGGAADGGKNQNSHPHSNSHSNSHSQHSVTTASSASLQTGKTRTHAPPDRETLAEAVSQRRAAASAEPRAPSPLRRSQSTARVLEDRNGTEGPESGSKATDAAADAKDTKDAKDDAALTASLGGRRRRVSAYLRPKVTAADVDAHIQDLAAQFRDNGVLLPLERIDDYSYALGGKKIMLSYVDSKLLVRTGGGFTPFLEYLERTKF